ncbi:MAG: amidohydrolase [Bacteroidales bacterium]
MSSVISEECLGKAIQLRKSLHRYPELSGQEKQTATRIKKFLSGQQPDEIIEDLGGQGLAAVYDSGKEGPSLLLRADLDALPIEEVNDFSYRSQHHGVSHKCGHDGHMAVLGGMASVLKKQRPKKGRIILLFQPEEENGQGAAKVIQDKKFAAIKPDYVFAFHNLPGFEKKQIVLREGPFASASKGMVIQMEGRSSHAAHPEQGNSPVRMLTRLINDLMEIPGNRQAFDDFTLLTIIHAKLGEVAFGTNPGKAILMATLRTYLDNDMDQLTKMAEKCVKDLSKKHNISTMISYTEVFPATVNHPEVSEMLRNAVQESGANAITVPDPFRWSEDFGHFTSAFKGALFGIGSGKNHPSLHNHDYDFPDDIIATGIKMFYHIGDQIVKLR